MNNSALESLNNFNDLLGYGIAEEGFVQRIKNILTRRKSPPQPSASSFTKKKQSNQHQKNNNNINKNVSVVNDDNSYDEILEQENRDIEREKPHLKKYYDEIIKHVKDLLKDPEYKILTNHIKFDTFEPRMESIYIHKLNRNAMSIYTCIISWDLWDIYPNARERFHNDDMSEISLFDKNINRIASDILKGSGYLFEYGGDWDSGLYMLIKVTK